MDEPNFFREVLQRPRPGHHTEQAGSESFHDRPAISTIVLTA